MHSGKRGALGLNRISHLIKSLEKPGHKQFFIHTHVTQCNESTAGCRVRLTPEHPVTLASQWHQPQATAYSVDPWGDGGSDADWQGRCSAEAECLMRSMALGNESGAL